MTGSGLGVTMSGILIKSIGKFAFDKILGNEDKSILDKRFAKAVNAVSERMQVKYPHVLGGSIDSFFKDSTVLEELFKLLFRSSKIDIDEFNRYFDLTTLPDGFIEEYIFELKNELLKYHGFERIFSDNEVYQMVLEINNNVNKLVSNYETAKTTFDFTTFYKEYTTVTIRNLSKINYFGLGLSPSVRRGEKTIKDIYVKPQFLEIDKNSEIGIDKIFDENENKNIVILGKPGAGKSLLGKYVMCEILKQDTTEIPINILDYIPFRIELRKYLPYKRKYSSNFIGYLLNVLHKEFYISSIEENDLINIFQTRKSLVIFDGLDEIFNIHNKIEVKNDIENFLSSYKKCKGVITSRHIGYEEAKLEEESFTEYNMLDFDDDQIEEYVNRWYDCEVVKDPDIENEINMFLLQADEIDDELITNPLLLSLIVILYRNNGRLPNSKLEIYRSCTKTLVDKWDETKELEIDVKVISKKQIIFSLLAFWQYECLSQNSQEIISYATVSKEVSSIIFKQLYLTDDYSEAEEWAEEFLEYAKNRSLYHEDDFTHKTFMEYFTAYCIYQKTDKKYKPQERNKIISKYISNPFWFIVLELLMNLIDEDQADNEIIDGIIEEHINVQKNGEAYIFFLHILNTLKNVSEGVKFSLIRESMSYAINKIEVNNFEIQHDPNGTTIKIVEEISSLIITESEAIQVIYDDLYEEFNNPNSLFKYYIFGAELKRSSRGGNFKINKDDYLEYYRKHNMYFYRNTTYLGGDIVDNTITFGETFGRESLCRRIKSPYYKNRYISSMYDYFNYNQLIISSKESKEIILYNYMEIINYGVPKSDLLKSINKFMGFFDEELFISTKEILEFNV
ncbi:NACHT domain-containing protein [Peribacillus frigoritolerans]|uniref:NACHT domain-containing protein n=1 Tax=Peribacillus frigoritolerans TaxID=450367 RepID=UPI0021AA2057|nr:NACHT domain-containing protein [Peribacillus frigoritolerans]MCT4477713.1 NACHT domain-containing protein [Peribacillus frigoritolerans]